MTGHLRARRRPVGSRAGWPAVGLAVALAACSTAGSATPEPSTVGASIEATRAPSPVATVAPSAAVPGGPDAAIDEPPAASIAVEGGDPVVGDLGSFSWQDAGSDSPWLPGEPIRIGSGERLTLTLAEPVPIGQWSASFLPSTDLGSITPVGLAAGSGQPVAFDSPPTGRWSVHVSLRFAGGLGSAAYYWLVEVE